MHFRRRCEAEHGSPLPPDDFHGVPQSDTSTLAERLGQISGQMKNPPRIFAEAENRQKIQNLLFEGGSHYSKGDGILNRTNTSLFSMLESISSENNLLASATGFEPVLSP